MEKKQEKPRQPRYRIIAHYSNGDTKEENRFCSRADLALSVSVYEQIFWSGKPLPFYEPAVVIMTGFEVWIGKKLAKREGHEVKL